MLGLVSLGISKKSLRELLIRDFLQAGRPSGHPTSSIKVFYHCTFIY